MSDQTPAPDVTTQTAPEKGGAVPLPRVARLLHIVQRLVAYGTKMIDIYQRGATTHQCFSAVFRFGTKDLQLILARMRCGLQRAALFQERLNRYVERGKDIPLPRPEPLSAPARVRAALSPAEAEARKARRKILSLIPTAEEIAEQVRTRPLGTVIGDICYDLGLAAGLMDYSLWEELVNAIFECGINLIGFINKSTTPVFGPLSRELENELAFWPEDDRLVPVVVQLRPP